MNSIIYILNYNSIDFKQTFTSIHIKEQLNQRLLISFNKNKINRDSLSSNTPEARAKTPLTLYHNLLFDLKYIHNL